MESESRLLVVEDDPPQREMLVGFLADLGFEVEEAENGEHALERLEVADFDLILADIRMPKVSGQELLVRVKEMNPETPFVLLTAFGTIKGALDSLRSGASDYLLKPLELDEVEHVVRRCIAERQMRRENRELRHRLNEVESIEGIVTAGGDMAHALSRVARVAPSSVSVLILGESGTGKELIARAIHAASPRANGPFVAVNAAALSPSLLESELFGHERGSFTGAEKEHRGRFESAAGGTLFLDEVGDLPCPVQVKILRALQERTIERVGSNRSIYVDVRVVAATHDDLLARVQNGTFREDLYYRLAVVSISIPPLRRRRADISLLIDHFLEKHSSLVQGPRRSISREALDLLVRYDFPGNVRELENLVQRILVLARGKLITVDDLPATVLAARESMIDSRLPVNGSLPARIAALERQAIEEALEQDGGNQSRAAARLGISERALRYKRAKYRQESQ